LLEAGQSERALQTLEGLPAAENRSAEAGYWHARCLRKIGDRLICSFTGQTPIRIACINCGRSEAAKGNDGKAIEEYRAAIALKPSLPNLHYSLGHLLWKDLKVLEARVELETELALNRVMQCVERLGETPTCLNTNHKALLISRGLWRRTPQFRYYTVI